MSLRSLSYRSGKLEYRSRHATEPEWVLATYLDEARKLLDAAPHAVPDALVCRPKVSADFEHLRWFPLPLEALTELRGGEASGSNEALQPST